MAIEVGNIFGMLKVKEILPGKNGKLGYYAYILCECMGTAPWCKKEILVKHQSNLITNKSTSCGCTKKRPRKSEVGKTYGFLRVLEDLPSQLKSDGRYAPMVRCECLACNKNKDFIVDPRSLRDGNTKTCNCKESYALLMGGEKNPFFKHGYSRKKHPAYSKWLNIRRRCRPGHKDSKDYYDRGIRVEEPWLSDAKSFCDWFDEKCGGDYTLKIERIDNDGNYCPENCTVATDPEQARNKRTNLVLTAFGVTAPLVMLMERFPHGLKYQTVWSRIVLSNWGVEEALTTPADSARKRPKNKN
jgi:hypothetical protein